MLNGPHLKGKESTVPMSEFESSHKLLSEPATAALEKQSLQFLIKANSRTALASARGTAQLPFEHKKSGLSHRNAARSKNQDKHQLCNVRTQSKKRADLSGQV